MPLFGAYLKHYRTEKGLSLRRIAEEVGVDPSIMSRLERGEVATPSDDVLKKLPELLGRPEAEVYLAAGRITPGLADVLEQGLPLTTLQAAKALAMLEEQLRPHLAELGDTPLSDLLTPVDQATAARIAEAMTHIAEIVQAMEQGKISATQFEHIAESIKHLKLSHVARD